MHATRPSARASARWIRWLFVVGLVIVIAAVTAAVTSQRPGPSSASPFVTSPVGAPPLRGEQRSVDETGRVGDGVTVFDEGVPALANLDPALLDALRQAATDAANDGIEIIVNSGWRSAEYQDQLLRDAIAEYGSHEEAARWVATAATSPHVTGNAVDLGPDEATAWLDERGAAYGLCQIYANEPWHYELRPDAVDLGCPALYADPTEDPRMQQ